jgi:hypothetical protein
MPPARAKVKKRPFWIQFIVVSPESLGCQWAAIQVLGKCLERPHGLWVAVNRNRHVNAGRTDALPRHEQGRLPLTEGF